MKYAIVFLLGFAACLVILCFTNGCSGANTGSQIGGSGSSFSGGFPDFLPPLTSQPQSIDSPSPAPTPTDTPTPQPTDSPSPSPSPTENALLCAAAPFAEGC